MTFQVIRRLRAHSRGARSICALPGNRFVSGGQAGDVAIWAFENGEWNISQVIAGLHDSSSVMALCGDGQGHFFSGGRDGIVKETCTATGTLIHEYSPQYPNAPISSLAVTNDRSYLLIGDWKGNCRVIDLNSKQLHGVLRGHQHAVTVASYEDQQGSVFVTGCQSGNIQFWRATDCTHPFKSLQRFHDDIVRGFAIDTDSKIIYTTSNDGKIGRILLGPEIKSDGHERLHHSFVYGLILLKSQLATCTEDRRIYLWNLMTWKNEGKLKLTSAVWQIARLSTDDIAAVDDSGDVSIWSADPDRWSEEVAEKLRAEEETLTAEESARKADALDLDHVPNISQLPTIRGKSEGQHQLFRNGNEVEVFQWSGNNWNKIGQVTDGPGEASPFQIQNKNFFKGDSFFPAGDYEFIFQVALGDSQDTTPLPYNRGDNLVVTAERFCARQQLNKALYLTEICEWITKQTAMAPAPSPAPAPTPVTPAAENTCPVAAYRPIVFSGGHLTTLRSRIEEFNGQVAPELQMTELEKSYLAELINKCDSPLFQQKELKMCELTLVFDTEKFERWGSELLLPLMDLRRVLATHPDIVELHKGTGGGWRLVKFALDLLKSDLSTKRSGGAGECAAKYLANLMSHPTCVNALHNFFGEFLRSLTLNVEGPRKTQTTRAIAAIIANLALFAERRHQHNEAEMIINWVVSQKPEEVADDDTVTLLLTAMATVAPLAEAGEATLTELVTSLASRSPAVVMFAKNLL